LDAQFAHSPFIEVLMIWQRIRKFRGLMIIMLWQAAPPVTVTESGGRIQYGFGYGQGRIDDILFAGGGCDAPPAEPELQTYRPKSVGVSVSGWTSPRLRLSGAFGFTSADTASLSGANAKAIVAGEWRLFGGGAGFSADAYGLLPGVYFRAGPLDKLHGRLDFPDLSLPVSSTGVGRLGLAYNQTDTGFGAFVGVPICYTSCNYGEGGVRADIRIPVGPSFDLSLSGFRNTVEDVGEQQKFWGVAVGGQIKR
jgi:hypothetical protein